MLIGGLLGSMFALSATSMPRPLFFIVLILIGIGGGALWGVVPGLLKALFNVHEVVSTIMMNWIAYWLVFYIVPGYLKAEYLETESKSIAIAQSLRTPWLTNLFSSEYVNYGIFLGILAMVFLKIILDKTTLGFELKAVGFNRNCGIRRNQSKPEYRYFDDDSGRFIRLGWAYLLYRLLAQYADRCDAIARV